MMNWFYKWVGKKIAEANSVDDGVIESSGLVPAKIGLNRAGRQRPIRESDELSSEPITFKMFKASGGWAIEFRQYDNKNDRIDTSLYVVNSEEELGKHISQIITMEALKR
jgi:hypothetical protein